MATEAETVTSSVVDIGSQSQQAGTSSIHICKQVSPTLPEPEIREAEPSVPGIHEAGSMIVIVVVLFS